MKSFVIIAISSIATLISATPDHVQEVAVTCTDPPVHTVTVTEACAPMTTSGAYSTAMGGSENSASTVTISVTVTETVAPVTITKAVTITESVGSGSSSSESLITFSTDLTTSSSIATIATTTTTAVLSKTTHDVLVGAFVDGNGTDFLFKPNNITAAIGDVVRFNMLGAAHSVTQSQFPKPCIKNGTFDTQLQPNKGNQTDLIFEFFEVNVTTPLWFYCKQTVKVSHCGKGMVFGINPKSQDQMQQFINMAEAQNGTFVGTAPPAVTSTASLHEPSGMAKVPRIKGRSARLS
ncbi:hypothetical protein MMC19_003889 [Ptychographa xylographoides]|nr:hypothetical protein [Ptychographa xylographoides]